MSVARTIGKGVAWNTISTIIGKIVAFLNVFIILRHLSVYEYGLSELIFSVVSTMSIVLLPGLASAITADLAVERTRGEFGRMKAVFLRYFSVNIALSVVAWSILFFGSSFVAHMAGNDSIGYFLKIASFSFIMSPLRGITQMLATVEARFSDQSFYGVIEEIAKGFLLLLFFFVFHYGVNGLLFAVISSQLMAFLVYIPRTLSAYRHFGHAEAKDGQVFWQILQHHRKWSVAVTYVNNLGKTMQLWIIRLLLGTEAVGLYAFATGVIGQLASFLPFSNVLVSILPRFIDRRDELIRVFRSSIKAQFMLSMLLLVCAYIGAPVLFWIFPKYNSAFLLLYVSLFSILPASIVGMYTPMFNTLKAQFPFFLSMVWKVVLSSVFLWLGITYLGIPGMGFAVVLGFVASMIERTFRLKRLLPEMSFSCKEFFSLDQIEITLLKKFFREIRTKRIFSIFQ